eukprot:4988844-Prymnesium_polylepis.2
MHHQRAPNASGTSKNVTIQRWKVLHGRPDVCNVAGAPSAVVLHAAYHSLWSYIRYSHRFPRDRTDAAAMLDLGAKRFPYIRGNRSLPTRVINRYATNMQTYARHVQKAFPEARLVAFRTAQLLDYVPFTRSRKYIGDWEA